MTVTEIEETARGFNDNFRSPYCKTQWGISILIWRTTENVIQFFMFATVAAGENRNGLRYRRVPSARETQRKTRKVKQTIESVLWQQRVHGNNDAFVRRATRVFVPE